LRNVERIICGIATSRSASAKITAAAFPPSSIDTSRTPAAAARKQIPEEVKAARLDVLQKLLQSQQYAFDDAQIGKALPVLFEKSAREAGRIMGRTPFSQPVHVQAPAALIGTIADVKITRRTANSLHGTLV